MNRLVSDDAIPAFIEFSPSAITHDDVEDDDLSISSADTDFSEAYPTRPLLPRRNIVAPSPEVMTESDLLQMTLKIKSLQKKLGDIERDSLEFADRCAMAMHPKNADTAPTARGEGHAVTAPEEDKQTGQRIGRELTASSSMRSQSQQLCCKDSRVPVDIAQGADDLHFVSLEISSVSTPMRSRGSLDCIPALQPTRGSPDCVMAVNTIQQQHPAVQHSTEKERDDPLSDDEYDDDESLQIEIISVSDILSQIPDLPFGPPPSKCSF